MEAVTAYPSPLEDLIPRTGEHQHLAEQRVALDVSGLLQQVGPDPSGGLAEELGDIENAEFAGRAETAGQVGTGDVERRARWDTERPKIENAGPGISQNNPRAGTWFRSCRNGTCSPRPWRGRGSCNGCMSAGPRGGGEAGRQQPRHGQSARVAATS